MLITNNVIRVHMYYFLFNISIKLFFLKKYYIFLSGLLNPLRNSRANDENGFRKKLKHTF